MNKKELNSIIGKTKGKDYSILDSGDYVRVNWNFIRVLEEFDITNGKEIMFFRKIIYLAKNEKHACTASNDYFASFMRTTDRNIRKYLADLKEKKLIKIYETKISNGFSQKSIRYIYPQLDLLLDKWNDLSENYISIEEEEVFQCNSKNVNLNEQSDFFNEQNFDFTGTGYPQMESEYNYGTNCISDGNKYNQKSQNLKTNGMNCSKNGKTSNSGRQSNNSSGMNNTLIGTHQNFNGTTNDDYEEEDGEFCGFDIPPILDIYNKKIRRKEEDGTRCEDAFNDNDSVSSFNSNNMKKEMFADAPNQAELNVPPFAAASPTHNVADAPPPSLSKIDYLSIDFPHYKDLKFESDSFSDDDIRRIMKNTCIQDYGEDNNIKNKKDMYIYIINRFLTKKFFYQCKNQEAVKTYAKYLISNIDFNRIQKGE